MNIYCYYFIYLLIPIFIDDCTLEGSIHVFLLYYDDDDTFAIYLLPSRGRHKRSICYADNSSLFPILLQVRMQNHHTGNIKNLSLLNYFYSLYLFQYAKNLFLEH